MIEFEPTRLNDPAYSFSQLGRLKGAEGCLNSAHSPRLREATNKYITAFLRKTVWIKDKED